MKWAVLILALAFLSILGLAFFQGRLETGFKASARSLITLGPMFLLALLVMGFTEVLLPQGWVERWLTDAAGARGLVIGWLAGFLTPGGSVIGMPLATGLLIAGASPAVVVTYLTSLATLNLLRLPMEVGIYGLRVMAIRLLGCLLVPFVAGGIARLRLRRADGARGFYPVSHQLGLLGRVPFWTIGGQWHHA
jgi:uncharacterized membrane protein YraQ (UPF0718 family)